MKIETLIKANELNKRIIECEGALACFESKVSEDLIAVSLNPSIIIEFNDTDRRAKVTLSDFFTDILKQQIIKAKNDAQHSFDFL